MPVDQTGTRGKICDTLNGNLDLSQKITVEVKGEVSVLKGTINNITEPVVTSPARANQQARHTRKKRRVSLLSHGVLFVSRLNAVWRLQKRSISQTPEP
jgi:hypothetical protein